MTVQTDLFANDVSLPEGLRYRPEFIPADIEQQLLDAMAALPFRAFEFRGYLGRRRVVSFGWAYDFNDRRLKPADAIPPFLLPLQQAAAAFAGCAAADLPQVLVTEYAPGAAIGWHRDRPEFGEVVGISLGSSCRFRFRRAQGRRWERRTLALPPRSAYLLRGPARIEWEHSIPPVDATRYSITFRSLRSHLRA